MNKNKNQLLVLIKASIFLSKDKKQKLLVTLPNLTEIQIAHLSIILKSEKNVLSKIISKSKTKDFGQFLIKKLKQIQKILSKANTQWLKATIKTKI